MDTTLGKERMMHSNDGIESNPILEDTTITLMTDVITELEVSDWVKTDSNTAAMIDSISKSFNAFVNCAETQYIYEEKPATWKLLAHDFLSAISMVKGYKDMLNLVYKEDGVIDQDYLADFLGYVAKLDGLIDRVNRQMQCITQGTEDMDVAFALLDTLTEPGRDFIIDEENSIFTHAGVYKVNILLDILLCMNTAFDNVDRYSADNKPEVIIKTYAANKVYHIEISNSGNITSDEKVAQINRTYQAINEGADVVLGKDDRSAGSHGEAIANLAKNGVRIVAKNNIINDRNYFTIRFSFTSNSGFNYGKTVKLSEL